jgi:transcriptional regulator with XRE-family HTH domain
MLDLCTQFKIDTGKTIKEVSTQSGLSVDWIRDMVTGKLPYNERLERKLNHISKDTGIALDILIPYAKKEKKVSDDVVNLITVQKQQRDTKNNYYSLKVLSKRIQIIENQVQAIIGE